MLVIFSDIHLTDETTAVNVAPEAFDILANEINSNAKDKKAKEIRVILLGDIFDLVRTDYWLKLPRGERPWNGELDRFTCMNTHPKLEEHFFILLNHIINKPSGTAFLKMLNNLKANNPGIPIYINYVIGNHDRAFNNYETLKILLSEKLRDIDGNKIEFLNFYYASKYKTLCRHGNEFDENNYGYSLYNILLKNARTEPVTNRFDPEIYKVNTIGEVVTCELMSGLIYRVQQKLKDTKFTKLLMDMNNVRPMLNVFSWLYWYGKDLTEDKQNAIMDAFIESLKEVIDTDLAKEWTKIDKFPIQLKVDLIDIFKIILNLIKDKDFYEVSKYVEIAKFLKKFHHTKDHFVEGAKFEWSLKSIEELQYVFYGHTHISRNDFLEGHTNGLVKMYSNTGTYLPFIEQTEDKEGFTEAYQMTMAFVYSGEEDTNGKADSISPSLDIWNGIKRKKYKES